MFETAILDVAIGLVFVFVLTSLMCSGLKESLAAGLKRRQKMLSKAIDRLLAGQKVADVNGCTINLSEKLKSHPLIKNLSRKDGGKPSYISSGDFALALIDTVENAVQGVPRHGTSVHNAIDALPVGELRTTLLALLKGTRGEVDELKDRIEDWYDDFMERVSGWYKRESHTTMFIIGFVVAVAFNMDTLAIGRALWDEPALRAAVVESARNLKQEDLDATDEKVLLEKLNAPKLPIGWPDKKIKALWDVFSWAGFLKLLGLLITAAAVSLGAQFWFNGLQRLLDLRAAGGRPVRQSERRAAKTVLSPTPAVARVATETMPLIGPQNAFETTMLAEDDIRDIQLALGLRGEQATGGLDSKTRTLIREFQQRVGRSPTGVLTPFIVERILAVE